MVEIPQKRFKRLDALLSTDGGRQTGGRVPETNAAVDGSVEPVEFYIQPPDGQIFLLSRMMVLIECSRVGFSADTYGNIDISAGTGVDILLINAINDEVICDLTAGLRVKHNSEWGAQCFDSEVDNYGTGNRAVRVRWTFEKAGQKLFLDKDTRLSVIINDNFSTLVSQYNKVEGVAYEV